jgi:hypothetical protein
LEASKTPSHTFFNYEQMLTRALNRNNKDGSMRDGNHEGHPGHRIDEIIKDIDLSSNTKPNLYLINAGTNDCQQNYLGMQGTIDRFRDLIDKGVFG